MVAEEALARGQSDEALEQTEILRERAGQLINVNQSEKELRALEDRVRPELRARAYNKAMECLKGRKVGQINRATAEAVISYELRQRGCEFFYQFQAHRVKVSIRVGENGAMAFFVRFKDIREGRLTGILDTAAGIAKQINQSGLNISISTGWKNFAGWQK